MAYCSQANFHTMHSNCKARIFYQCIDSECWQDARKEFMNNQFLLYKQKGIYSRNGFFKFSTSFTRYYFLNKKNLNKRLSKCNIWTSQMIWILNTTRHSWQSHESTWQESVIPISDILIFFKVLQRYSSFEGKTWPTIKMS